jgi:hypothetical protein
MLFATISSVTGWGLIVLLIVTTAYPFLLRGGMLGPVQPFLRRMRVHYWLGYGIASITLVHAWVAMSEGTAGRLNSSGLYLATVALLLMVVQIVLGRRLSFPKLQIRRVVRRWHFWVMVGIVVFVVGHILLNGGVI